MPEDIAITSSKSDVDPFSHGRDPDGQKSADRQTDGRTDGFSTLYSRYIYIYIYVAKNLNCIINHNDVLQTLYMP